MAKRSLSVGKEPTRVGFGIEDTDLSSDSKFTCGIESKFQIPPGTGTCGGTQNKTMANYVVSVEKVDSILVDMGNAKAQWIIRKWADGLTEIWLTTEPCTIPLTKRMNSSGATQWFEQWSTSLVGKTYLGDFPNGMKIAKVLSVASTSNTKGVYMQGPTMRLAAGTSATNVGWWYPVGYNDTSAGCARFAAAVSGNYDVEFSIYYRVFLK